MSGCDSSSEGGCPPRPPDPPDGLLPLPALAYPTVPEPGAEADRHGEANTANENNDM